MRLQILLCLPLVGVSVAQRTFNYVVQDCVDEAREHIEQAMLDVFTIEQAGLDNLERFDSDERIREIVRIIFPEDDFDDVAVRSEVEVMKRYKRNILQYQGNFGGEISQDTDLVHTCQHPAEEVIDTNQRQFWMHAITGIEISAETVGLFDRCEQIVPVEDGGMLAGTSSPIMLINKEEWDLVDQLWMEGDFAGERPNLYEYHAVRTDRPTAIVWCNWGFAIASNEVDQLRPGGRFTRLLQDNDNGPSPNFSLFNKIRSGEFSSGLDDLEITHIDQLANTITAAALHEMTHTHAAGHSLHIPPESAYAFEDLKIFPSVHNAQTLTVLDLCLWMYNYGFLCQDDGSLEDVLLEDGSSPDRGGDASDEEMGSGEETGSDVDMNSD